MRSLLFLLPLALLVACGGGEKAAPTCEEGCAVNQVCEEGLCVCDTDAVDCDADMSNGCEPASTCFCAFEGDAAFCERNGASCGFLAAADNCGNRRVIDCGAGSCPADQSCGAEVRNVCGEGECRAESIEGICAALEWQCGRGMGTDRCGEAHEIDCGDCPAGFACNPRRECTKDGIGPWEVCFAMGVDYGPCAPNLECVGGESYAVCVPLCSEEVACQSPWQCADSYFGNGIGLCGDLRMHLESCQPEIEGPGFCWDDTGTLACVSSTCHYVCDVQGQGEVPCPAGLFCGSTWRDAPELGNGVRVRVCQ